MEDRLNELKNDVNQTNYLILTREISKNIILPTMKVI
jgi:hypothetical protein